jgi:D-glucuronyl C5-epimerase-like protein
MAGLWPLLARGVRDLSAPSYPVASGYRLDGSGPYPLDLRPASRSFRLDAGGVVVVPGPGPAGYHNPVSVSLYALARHADAAAGPGRPGEGVAGFLAQARHLRRSQDAQGGWRYPVPVPRYRVAPGWYSAMAQGLAVSVLLRAHDLTGERSFRDAAEGAVRLLLTPVRGGGCADYDARARPFLEECPADPPTRVLNGAVFALFGLAEWETRTDGRAHRPAARRLAGSLAGYDTGYWSRYDLRFAAPATLAYHALHIALLRAAAQVFGDDRWAAAADRWRGYLRRPSCRLRAAAHKARFALGEHHDRG